MTPMPTTLLMAARSVAVRKVMVSGTRKVLLDFKPSQAEVLVVVVEMAGSSWIIDPGWPRSERSTSCNMPPLLCH